MGVVSFGELIRAVADADRVREQAKAEELKRLYTADYTRFLRDKTAYEADVQRQRDAALAHADRVLQNPTLATMLRASAGKNSAKIADLWRQWQWQQKAAQSFGRNPNQAVFFANLGGRRIDPFYAVRDGTLYGRYTGAMRPTQVGRARIQEHAAAAERNLAAAQKNLAEAFRAQMQAKRAQASAGARSGGRSGTRSISSALLQYIQQAMPAYGDAYFEAKLGDDMPDEAKVWATNRAISLIQWGLPVDAAIAQAAKEAAERTVKVEGLVDSLRFQPVEPPVPGAKLAPDGLWYVMENGQWKLVEEVKE